MIEDLLPYAAVGFLAIVLVMFGFGLKRGSKVQQTNTQIEANQRRMIDLSESQLATAERAATAQERIAKAIEKRVG